MKVLLTAVLILLSSLFLVLAPFGFAATVKQSAGVTALKNAHKCGTNSCAKGFRCSNNTSLQPPQGTIRSGSWINSFTCTYTYTKVPEGPCSHGWTYQRTDNNQYQCRPVTTPMCRVSNGSLIAIPTKNTAYTCGFILEG